MRVGARWAGAPRTSRAFSTSAPRRGGLNELYGDKAKGAMQGMVAPGATAADGRESTAIPLPGRATVEGTAFTVERSTVFEKWNFRCPSDVGWSMSKLGCTTCKMPLDPTDAEDSIQLQIIKGLNVFEIDPQATDVHQKLSRTLTEAMQAFELAREGFIITSRGGIIREPLFQSETAETTFSNTSAVVAKWRPIVNRFRTASLPQMSLKSGFKLSEMDDKQLAQLQMRRIDERTAATLSPEWLEASLTNLAHNTKIETIDVFFIEGMHTLFDGRDDAEIDKQIIDMFKFLEVQAERGAIQYYGISSPHLAPPVARKPLNIPKDANMPKKWLQPPKPPVTIDLHRLMRLAETAADGKQHRLRFLQYPFNLTMHQARSTPLPYDTRHTLVSLAKHYGLTTMGTSPIESPDVQGLPQRYHKFPMDSSLKQLRQGYLSVVERCLIKEMEMAPNIEKAPHSMPKMTDVFIASLLLAVQRQTDNLFFFNDWIRHKVLPNFHRGLVRLREGSPADVKEWAQSYQQLVDELVSLRRRMFEFEHGRRALSIDAHINTLSPALEMCPIMAQKALNFATYGADVTVCGFHRSRYFLEATEMNPVVTSGLVVPEEELQALMSSPDVSYADTNPPDPYMYDVLVTPKISGQKPRFVGEIVHIDPQNPKYPDCPDDVLEE